MAFRLIFDIIPDRPCPEKVSHLGTVRRASFVSLWRRTAKALHEPESREDEQTSDDGGHDISERDGDFVESGEKAQQEFLFWSSTRDQLELTLVAEPHPCLKVEITSVPRQEVHPIFRSYGEDFEFLQWDFDGVIEAKAVLMERSRVLETRGRDALMDDLQRAYREADAAS